ncbi:hypothetical protein P343_16600 [Sporolactobacillus laevolacticus DSM 442]|uniref:Cell wall elongation regulator TseB-like domain-containing protein n=1 Tax=Sporolactobacillus laevolacticus DSM 442 TaxID=1395513 RepID=V6IU61_9BACL|nr:hypothetical protein P343_16600 [Sporolactobacillus laevolacticus DSM 442]
MLFPHYTYTDSGDFLRRIKAWLITAAIAVFILFCFGSWKLYFSNMHFQDHSAVSAINKAKKWYHFDHVKSVTAYHGTDAYQVIQAKQKGKMMYFWVPDHPKKAPYIERQASKGITKKQAIQRLFGERLDIKSIISVRLGAIHGHPVWEITFMNSKNNYNYVSLYFDNGKEAQRILNL